MAAGMCRGKLQMCSIEHGQKLKGFLALEMGQKANPLRLHPAKLQYFHYILGYWF